MSTFKVDMMHQALSQIYSFFCWFKIQHKVLWLVYQGQCGDDFILLSHRKKLLKSSFVKYFLQGRRDPLTVTYYINLLISNLVQLCILFVWVARLDGTTCAALTLFSVTANIDFSICIALERYQSLSVCTCICVNTLLSCHISIWA